MKICVPNWTLSALLREFSPAPFGHEFGSWTLKLMLVHASFRAAADTERLNVVRSWFEQLAEFAEVPKDAKAIERAALAPVRNCH